MTLFGYARVSTRGQSLKEQIDELKYHDVKNKYLYHEKFTGTTTKRPELERLLKVVRPGDTIIITKLDRLARKTEEAINLINHLLSQKITLKVLGLGTIENTPMGRMIVRTIASVAEMERDLIVERTEAGKAFARQHNPNFHEGRPTRLHSKKKQKYEAIYHYKKNHSARETAEAYDVSIRTVHYVISMFKNDNYNVNDLLE